MKESLQLESQRKRLSAFEKIVNESSSPIEGKANKEEGSEVTDLLKKSSYYQEKEGDISLEFEEIQNEINKFSNDNNEEEKGNDEEDNIKASNIS